jgi:hypothetical protein
MLLQTSIEVVIGGFFRIELPLSNEKINKLKFVFASEEKSFIRTCNSSADNYC